MYGDRYKRWHLQSDEILKEAKIQKENKFLKNWFSNKTFSLDEIKIVYQTLASEARSENS